jgi:hypothetical protein
VPRQEVPFHLQDFPAFMAATIFLSVPVSTQAVSPLENIS